MNRISVVIRTRNGIETARQTFAALRSQTVRTPEWIVMDCESTDGVRELAVRYGARIHSVVPEEYVPSEVLNRAVKAASGDIIVFVNSDTVPLSPTTLERLLEPLLEGEATASFGRQVARPEALSWVQRDYLTAFPPTGPAPEWLPLSLPLSAIRKSALVDHPFYAEAWASEDTEWGTRARERGEQIAYVPDALCMHSHNYSLSEIYGRRFVEGEADAYINRALRPSLASLARRIGAAIARDLAHIRNTFAWGEVVTTPIRRAVYWTAWARGHALGRQRIALASPSLDQGRDTILRLRKDQ